MTVLKKTLIFLFAVVAGLNGSAQTLLNGNFNSGSSNWGCNPEAYNPETTYGGSNNHNTVAEVDQEAGLCQTISGFTVGSLYTISFKCSRRTTCGPTFQSIHLSVSNNALDVNISRNGGGFNFTLESFSFIATSTTHTINFTSNTSGTCNLILDNLTLNVTSPLPIELMDFTAQLQDKRTVALAWQTASEKNNDYFTVERSIDGENWIAIQEIKGAGNSNSVLSYDAEDILNEQGTFYYRLKQTDYDGEFTYSMIRSVDCSTASAAISIYPNPTTGIFKVEGSKNEQAPKIYNSLGVEISTSNYLLTSTETSFLFDIRSLPTGIYFLEINHILHKVVRN
jgi:hypothetical protein